MSAGERRPTELEIEQMQSSKRKTSIIIVTIIIVSVATLVAAYFLLRDTPCELVSGDMCGFVGMDPATCPSLAKTMTEMGADDPWCANIIAGKEELEPEQVSGHYQTALRELLNENLDRHTKAGTEPPQALIKLQERVDPSAYQKRMRDAEPPPPQKTATDPDAGAAGDGSAAAGDAAQ